MDFYNSFKRILGLPTKENGQNQDTNGSHSSHVQDNFTRNLQEGPTDDYERFGFNVFTSPLEMHRYFESQMNTIMKSFGMFNNDGSFFGNNEDSFYGDSKEPLFGNRFNFGSSQFPKFEDYHQNSPSGDVREHYLKSGYEDAKSLEQSKTDRDLDGQFDMGDLDSVLKGQPPQFQKYMYGQSMLTKTIRNADGTVETHRTIQDQQGNKEITVKYGRGDKEYSVITKIDKNGRKEVVENLINMDEKEKDFLFKRSDNVIQDKNLSPNWFPFSKFFE